MARSFANMIRDTYGPDKKSWPSINVIVLTEAGKDSESAYKCLNEDFWNYLETLTDKVLLSKI